MDLIKYPEKKDWSTLLKRPSINVQALEDVVRKVLVDVKVNGDSALKKYTLQFDGATLHDFKVTDAEFSEAIALVPSELKQAILMAKANIEKFHLMQKEEIKKIETTSGVLCWRKSVGIEKVGLYIPGGSAPLFSTVLMLGVPAKIAGCEEIVLCTPPDKNGKVDPVILYASQLLGIKNVFKLGGVQAIASMAYGTESVPAVYKIFGPGNQYVTCAKKIANSGGVAIDMPAGPSELAVLADESSVPEYVAADLLSQAEHGEDSQVILVSDSIGVIEKVMLAIDLQLNSLPRKDVAIKSLQNSKAILVRDKMEGMALLNEYAPEHLILACEDNDTLSECVVNAGSVFLGNFSCESAGDYASGTNHTLPTNGNAKAYSGVSLDSFVKKITFQKLSEEGINNIGKTIELMAAAEGLEGHKSAVSRRLLQTKKKEQTKI